MSKIDEMSEVMTDAQREYFKRWMIAKVRVGADSERAMIYNLVQMFLDGPRFEPYDNRPDQDDQVAEWLSPDWEYTLDMGQMREIAKWFGD